MKFLFLIALLNSGLLVAQPCTTLLTYDKFEDVKYFKISLSNPAKKNYPILYFEIRSAKYDKKSFEIKFNSLGSEKPLPDQPLSGGFKYMSINILVFEFDDNSFERLISNDGIPLIMGFFSNSSNQKICNKLTSNKIKSISIKANFSEDYEFVLSSSEADQFFKAIQCLINP